MTTEKLPRSNQHTLAMAWRLVLGQAFAFFGVFALALVSAIAVFHTAYHASFQFAGAVRVSVTGIALLGLGWYLLLAFPLSARRVLSAYCGLLGALMVGGSLVRIGGTQPINHLRLWSWPGLD